MRKKATVVALLLALVSAMTLANVAFAAQSDKLGNSPPGKANGGKANGKAAVSTDQVNGGVEKNVKCTILHKGKEITVSINALPAHVLNHGDTLVGGADEQSEDVEQSEDIEQSEDTEQSEDVEELGDCQALYDALTDTELGATTSEGTASERMMQASPGETTDAQQENEPEEVIEGTGGNTETVKTCDGKSTKLSKEEKLTLDLHNKTRKENELKELCVDPTLTKVAREHSKDMVKKGYFGHNSPDGKSSAKRVKDSGYDWSATAENIGWGSGSYSKPESRFKAWLASKGHKKNILNGKYEEVGIGIASGELKKGGKGQQTVYTVDFGSKKKQ